MTLCELQMREWISNDRQRIKIFVLPRFITHEIGNLLHSPSIVVLTIPYRWMLALSLMKSTLNQIAYSSLRGKGRLMQLL